MHDVGYKFIDDLRLEFLPEPPESPDLALPEFSTSPDERKLAQVRTSVVPHLVPHMGENMHKLKQHSLEPHSSARLNGLHFVSHW